MAAANCELFDTFFHAAPPSLDLDGIRREWQTLRASPYRVEDRHPPLPVWARRAFTESEPEAWDMLRAEAERIDPARPMAIYLHIPFCARRCHFCDCYSFKLQSHRAEHIERYISLLDQEMRLWSQLGTLAQRPVSTVHFGGGTPTVLGAEAFQRVVERCRAYFNTDERTEWALEATSSEFTDEMRATLESLGFTRLHIGVQSLEDRVRQAINRQESARAVLDKIQGALAGGWIVTVDMIFGLPGQTLAGYLGDLTTLTAAGVDGYSLYELQTSPRNRAWIEQHGLDQQPRVLNYFFAQAGARWLEQAGYRQTLFNHWAGQHDTNLYFTFPERGEDLLALGTIADGMFGDYHYRHPTYADYCRGVSGEFPGLQGGLRRNALENRLHPLTTMLLAGRVTDPVLRASVPTGLWQHWQNAALLVPDTGDQFRLSGNGAWLVGNMISQLVADAPRTEEQARRFIP